MHKPEDVSGYPLFCGNFSAFAGTGNELKVPWPPRLVPEAALGFLTDYPILDFLLTFLFELVYHGKDIAEVIFLTESPSDRESIACEILKLFHK